MMLPDIFSFREKRLILVWLLWELCNLAAIKYADSSWSFRTSCLVMYLPICFNTLVTGYFFIRYGREKKSWHNVLALGLFMTFVADFFLTLLNSRLPGFISFCLVEAVYAVYFRPSGKNILLRACLFVIALGILHRTDYFDLANVFGILNITLLSVNVFCALFLYLRERTGWSLCLALGFACFAGCDYTILFRTFTNGDLYRFLSFLLWIFYIPAQILIVSGYALAIKSKKCAREVYS